MGVCYEDGMLCEKDEKKALEYYEKAANLGNSTGIIMSIIFFYWIYTILLN